MLDRSVFLSKTALASNVAVLYSRRPFRAWRGVASISRDDRLSSVTPPYRGAGKNMATLHLERGWATRAGETQKRTRRAYLRALSAWAWERYIERGTTRVRELLDNGGDGDAKRRWCIKRRWFFWFAIAGWAYARFRDVLSLNGRVYASHLPTNAQQQYACTGITSLPTRAFAFCLGFRRFGSPDCRFARGWRMDEHLGASADVSPAFAGRKEGRKKESSSGACGRKTLSIFCGGKIAPRPAGAHAGSAWRPQLDGRQ